MAFDDVAERLLKMGLPRKRLVSVRRLASLAVLALMAAGLGGCGAMIADLPLVGLPADAPPRRDKGAFLPVNDLPGQRDSAKLESAEQIKIRADLAAAREKQAAAAAAAAK